MGDLTWHPSKITSQERYALNGHKSCVIWLTGLSGSGKSTIAVELERQFIKKGIHSYVLDGDNVRLGLNSDLGFSPEDRKEHIRRVGEVAKLFMDAGIVVISAFISPYADDREMVRQMMNSGEFVEVYVKCSVEECERRDPKGLYKKARLGQILQFTGVSAPYEAPLSPELIMDTEQMTLDGSVEKILNYLQKNLYTEAAND